MRDFQDRFLLTIVLAAAVFTLPLLRLAGMARGLQVAPQLQRISPHPPKRPRASSIQAHQLTRVSAGLCHVGQLSQALADPALRLATGPSLSNRRIHCIRHVHATAFPLQC